MMNEEMDIISIGGGGGSISSSYSSFIHNNFMIITVLACFPEVFHTGQRM